MGATGSNDQTGEPDEKHIEGSVTLSDSPEVPASDSAEAGDKVPAPPGPDPEPTPRTTTLDGEHDESETEGVAGGNVVEDGIHDVSTDQAPVPGGWVDVVSGEHQGRRGAWVRKDGERLLVRTRDELNEVIDVAIDDVRRAVGYAGGR